jgi:hypothetical protein
VNIMMVSIVIAAERRREIIKSRVISSRADYFFVHVFAPGETARVGRKKMTKRRFLAAFVISYTGILIRGRIVGSDSCH